MAIFPKVVQESGGEVDLKASLEQKLRQNKIRELDEAAVETNVQSLRTKTAEMEAKEVEAQSRKVNAESSMMDKFMPTGVWHLLTEVLKDKNPQAPMTVQDMLTILEYARGQQAEAPAESPSEGMWGFLATMITQMTAQNKSISPLELIQTMQQVNMAMQPQQQGSGGMLSQFTEMATLMQTMKSLFTPAQGQNGNPSALIGMPGGGAIPLNDLISWQEHGFNLQLKRDEHDEKMKNFQAVRENTPAAIKAISDFAMALRGEGEKPETGKKETIQPKGKKEPAEGKPETQEMTCPDCNMTFSIPAGIEGEVVCPKCSMQVFQRMEEANAGKTDQGEGQGKGPGKQGKHQGSNEVTLP